MTWLSTVRKHQRSQSQSYNQCKLENIFSTSFESLDAFYVFHTRIVARLRPYAHNIMLDLHTKAYVPSIYLLNPELLLRQPFAPSIGARTGKHILSAEVLKKLLVMCAGHSTQRIHRVHEDLLKLMYLSRTKMLAKMDDSNSTIKEV